MLLTRKQAHVDSHAFQVFVPFLIYQDRRTVTSCEKHKHLLLADGISGKQYSPIEIAVDNLAKKLYRARLYFKAWLTRLGNLNIGSQ